MNALTEESLVPEEKGMVFTKAVIRKIYKLSDKEKQSSELHHIIITDKDPSIIEIEIIIN